MEISSITWMSLDVITFIFNLLELWSPFWIYIFLVNIFLQFGEILVHFFSILKFLFKYCFCPILCPIYLWNYKWKYITLFHQSYVSLISFHIFVTVFALYTLDYKFSAISSSSCLITSADYGSTHLLNFEFQLVYFLKFHWIIFHWFQFSEKNIHHITYFLEHIDNCYLKVYVW